LSRQPIVEEDPEGLPDFTLPVAIAAQLIASLAVDIKAQSVGNLKVDIAAQSLTTLNVNIASSSVTLNVNITAQSVTLNINILDFKATITPTALLEKGEEKIAWMGVSGGRATLYDCPVGKTCYLVTLHYNAINTSPTYRQECYVKAYIGSQSAYIVYFNLEPNGAKSETITGGIIKLNAGDYLEIYASTYASFYVSVVVIAV
jgi:hypothetical protein